MFLGGGEHVDSPHCLYTWVDITPHIAGADLLKGVFSPIQQMGCLPSNQVSDNTRKIGK
jgi:hypothetical protein